jgi:hypothetical protein
MKMKNSWSPADEDKVIAMYRSGVPYYDMARRFSGLRSSSACEAKLRELRRLGRVEYVPQKRTGRPDKEDHFADDDLDQPFTANNDLFRLWERANQAISKSPSA